jgi:hypothetical protein
MNLLYARLLLHFAEISPRFSPGYMMTKLTRTILSNDPELKVTLLLHSPFLRPYATCQKTWESLTPLGRVWKLMYLLEQP